MPPAADYLILKRRAQEQDRMVYDALTKDKEAGCVKGCKTFRSCMSAVRAN